MADEDTSQPPAEPTAPVEPATAPEVAPSEPAEATQPETPTAQIPASEPFAPAPPPIQFSKTPATCPPPAEVDEP